MENKDFMVITFTGAGEVSAMHRDEFSLGFLGKQEIKRASEIKFNDDTQLWDVALPGIAVHGETPWLTIAPAMGFKTYNGARKFEVLWLEHCALEQVDPLAERGSEIAYHLRANYVEVA
jgi:hypothetical protein